MLPTNAPDDIAQAYNACTDRQRAVASYDGCVVAIYCNYLGL